MSTDGRKAYNYYIDAILFLPIFHRFVQSWIDTRDVQSERANLTILFDRYIPTCLDTMRVRFKKVTPITDISMIQTLCYLLEALLTPENTPPDTAKEIYEYYFVFAAVWAFGGAMFQDQVQHCVSTRSIVMRCLIIMTHWNGQFCQGNTLS